MRPWAAARERRFEDGGAELTIRIEADIMSLARILRYAVRKQDARGAVATFVDVTTLHDRESLQTARDG